MSFLVSNSSPIVKSLQLMSTSSEDLLSDTYLLLSGSSFSRSLQMDLPRFKRQSIHGKRICYLTIPEPGKKGHAHLTLYNIKEVKEYLIRIGYHGAALQEALTHFDFTVQEKRTSESQNDVYFAPISSKLGQSCCIFCPSSINFPFSD